MPSTKLSDALKIAEKAHYGETRKGTQIPYITHPLAVASLVAQYGGDESQIVAALIHDAIGDGGILLEDVEKQFGGRVSDIVHGFLDPPQVQQVEKSLLWREIKEVYLQKLRGLPDFILLVIACEELHEIRELLHDVKYTGAQAWKRYPAHSMEVFWYFRELLVIFNKKLTVQETAALKAEFASALKSMKDMVFEGGST